MVYTDASVDARFTTMLSRLGWDVKTAQQAGLTGKIPDVKWVIYARKHHRIAITFDELRGQHGEEVSRELRRRGGKIVRVSGSSDPFRSIGKLLYHYPNWYRFLKDNNGVSVIHDINPQRCKNFTPEEYHHTCHPTDAKLFEEYLKKRRKRPYHPRKRKQHPADPSQGMLT